MKNYMKTGLAAAGLVLCPQAVLADEIEDDGAIVVTANGIEQPREEAGQAISVITGEELEQRQVEIVSDALRFVPGITVARNGPIGSATSVFIRGGDSAHTLVLVDGVRINDPSAPSGAFDFGNLVTGNIDRIEVLRGPNSVIWGSQALGGVVNISTVQPGDELTVRARGEYGYRDTLRGSANIAGRAGRIGGSIGASYARSDGISAFDEASGGSEKDGFRNFTGHARLDVTLADGLSLDLRGFYTDSRLEFDNPPADTLPVTDTEQLLGYAGLNLSLFDGRLKNRLAYGRTDIDRVTRDPDPFSFNPFEASGKLDRFEYQGVIEPVDAVTLIIGAEHEISKSSSFFLAFDPAPDRTRTEQTSYYGQAIVRPFAGLSLAGGVRVDDHQVYGSKTSLGANFAWTPNAGHTVLRGTYAEGFRAPALSELLANFGNPGLIPETAKSYDFGIEQSFLDGRVTASATWFHRRTRNLIVFSASTFTLENIASARVQGVEIGFAASPTDRLSLQAQFSLIDSRNLSREADFNGNIPFGNDLARRPAHTASLSLDWTSPWDLALGASLLIVADSFDDAANTIPLDGYALVDLRASYPLGSHAEIFARLENVTGERYQTAFNFGSPGRAGYAGIRLRL
ncbi:MAG: TonB-dependent receptor [Blastomonas sp.]